MGKRGYVYVPSLFPAGQENRSGKTMFKVRNGRKSGKNGIQPIGTQRCMCKECGTRYTIAPKIREYPEGARELAIKMYYFGGSGRGVGKVLGMSKANIYNWIKKRTETCIHNRSTPSGRSLSRHTASVSLAYVSMAAENLLV